MNSLTPQSVKTLYLVDGSSYLFRAYHALPELKTSYGQETGAIYGIVSMLRRMLTKYKPQHMAVIFDTKEENFRHKIYNEYKANRVAMPNELSSQIDFIHQIIAHMGIPSFSKVGFEADDIIAAFSKQAEQIGWHIVIASNDKDLAQLVNDKIILIDTMKDKVLDAAAIKEKFNILPAQIIDYLSLIGDSVDNIPGVPKVGPVTAAKWLNKYNSLDEIIAHKHEITGKVGENLRNNIDFIYVARQLISLKTDVDLLFEEQSMLLQSPNDEALNKIFQHLEFKSWLKKQNNLPKFSMKEDKIITSKDDLVELTDKLSKCKKIYFFINNTLSVSNISLSATEIPIYHIILSQEENGISEQDVTQHLQHIYLNSTITKITYDLKSQIHSLRKLKFIIKNKIPTCFEDIMLLSYVLDSRKNKCSLPYLTQTYLNYDSETSKQHKTHDFCDSNAIKINSIYHLYSILFNKIIEQKDLLYIYQQIEIPLSFILFAMENKGIQINKNLLQEYSQEFSRRLANLTQKIFAATDCEFNIDSPKQLQEILFTKLKMPVISKTKGGMPSTSEEVLIELAESYELPKIILQYRALKKLKSTYVDALIKEHSDDNNLVHTSFHQITTATGRLSSSEPNLQNIPIKNEDGKKIRATFIARPNQQLVVYDYSQIELRIMAHLAQEENLLAAFKQNIDVHTATATQIFNLQAHQVNSEHRRRAKAVNFGLIYGMSAFGLAKNLKISFDEAQQYVNNFFAQYPKIKEYMLNIRDFAHEHEYVATSLGRRLYLPEINSRNKQRKSAAERLAINAPLQGFAADIIKLAMIKIDEYCQQNDVNIQMLVQVHDELIFEMPKNVNQKHIDDIRNIMENVVSLSVPLIVNVGIATNWFNAHS